MLGRLRNSTAGRFAILMVGAGSLAACGGGDGTNGGLLGDPGGTGVLGSWFVPSWNAYETAAANLADNVEYQSQTTPSNFPWVIGGVQRFTNAILSSGVQYAHAAGLTGAGQTVAVIDSGFRESHEALAGAVLAVSPADTIDDHGTAVAAIIAGQSSSFIGIAPGAELYLQDYISSYQQMANATLWALNNDAVAQNNSWGPGDGFGNELLATSDGLDAFVLQGATPYLNAVSAYASQGVVVFAVSNDESLSQIDLMAGLPGLAGYEGTEDGWLAVTNGFPEFDSNGNLTDVYMVSASCLQAANWCLTANGSWEHIPIADSNTSYDYGTGSSFAAPQVAGALALLAEAFPDLTPHELRIRLLASADNSFFNSGNAGTVNEVEIVAGYTHDVSDVYGFGFLDIAAALLPIGNITSNMADGTKVDISKPLTVTGSAMGDAVQKSLEAVKVNATDGLGADFAVAADNLFAGSQPEPLAAKMLPRAISADLTALRTAPLSPLTDVFANQQGQTFDLADPNSGFTAAVLLPEAGSGSGNIGVSLMKTLEAEGFRFDFGLKLSRDDGSLIGFGDTGHGGGATELAALQLGLSQDFAGGGFLSLSGEVGIANLSTPFGFNDVSDARFNAVGLELGQRNAFTKGDRLSLGVSLPMAVTGGSASLDLPIFGTRAAGDAAEFQTLDVDLSPDARQLDFAVTYQMPLGDGQELMLKAMRSENYGNIEGVTDNALVAAFKWSF